MSTLVTTALRHNTSASNNVVLDSSGNVGVLTPTPLGRFAAASATGQVGFNTGTSSSPERGNIWYDTDGTGWRLSIGKRQSGSFVAQMAVVDNGDFQFDSGYGSVATAFGCRAWVNFNGTGAVAIRGSGNVSSITDGGTGDYTVNFTNAMPDANYSVVCNGQFDNASTTSSNISVSIMRTATAQVAGSIRVASFATSTGALLDFLTVTVAVFR